MIVETLALAALGTSLSVEGDDDSASGVPRAKKAAAMMAMGHWRKLIEDGYAEEVAPYVTRKLLGVLGQVLDEEVQTTTYAVWEFPWRGLWGSDGRRIARLELKGYYLEFTVSVDGAVWVDAIVVSGRLAHASTHTGALIPWFEPYKSTGSDPDAFDAAGCVRPAGARWLQRKTALMLKRIHRELWRRRAVDSLNERLRRLDGFGVNWNTVRLLSQTVPRDQKMPSLSGEEAAAIEAWLDSEGHPK